MRQARGLTGLAAGVTLALFASACGSGAGAAPNAPVLHVVTAAFPFAQAVAQIGAGKVQVTDVVPDGQDPLTYQPTAQQVEQIRSAGLVVEVGGGFQPGFEAAARRSAHVVGTADSVPGTTPYVWLDPTSMQSAVKVIASAMEQADPLAAPLYREEASAYDQLVASDGIDFQSTLATCTRDVIVTADAAFSVMAHDYGLRDLVVGTDPSPGLAAQVNQTGLSRVFAETWTDNNGVEQVAASAGVKVDTLDTLTGPPPTGWPKASYPELLESDLGTLSSALGCDDGSGT